MSRRFVGLFSGTTTRTARMVAAVADSGLVCAVAEAALQRIRQPEDPVLACIEQGNKAALEQVLREEKASRKVSR